MSGPDLTGGELASVLAERPGGFSFFQAVRLLERLDPDRTAVGGWGDPTEEAVQFTVPPSFAFPRGEIASVERPEDGAAPARVTLNMMGLVGPSGVLPHEYTRFVADRERARDPAMRAFLDIFHHRIVSLFYLAWRKRRVELHEERPPEGGGIPRYLLDALGLGLDAWQDRQEVPDRTLLHYAGLLGPEPRSAGALGQILRDRLGIPVRVEEFVGGWFPLRTGDQCRLGEEGDAACLGRGAVVGDEVWDAQSRVRLHLGPMDRDTFDRLLPGGDLRRELAALVRFHGQDQFEFELRLILRAEDIRGVRLGEADESPARLGWGSWLASRPRTRDGDETVLTL